MAQKKSEKATIELVINGQQGKATLKDIRAAVISVERELNKMKKDEDPAGWKKQIETLRKLRQAQADVTTELRGGVGSLNSFNSGWGSLGKSLLGAAGIVGGLAAAKSAIGGLITFTGKLSDEFSDIQKTTGLTGAEVRALNKDLQGIDTRTPVEELRRLAAEAGRLGFTAKEDILGFVRASDQIQVALGDVLGEDATKDMAKIVDIFKLDDLYGTEGGLLRIGSAINEIGMASTANEGYVVDFVKRMSGISGVANVSVPELVALGGTLDSLGQSSEVGSTALSKVLVKMGSEVPTYAKMAGKSVDEFRKVLERSAMEGLMLVLKNVGQTTEGIEALSATLGDLGLDGGRVVGILGTLAKNTDEYNRQLSISNKAMLEGTSVTEEFMVKNTNAQAVLEKWWKILVNTAENAALAVDSMITDFGRLTGAISKSEQALIELKKQEEFVAQSEKELIPLISRYRELEERVKKGEAASGDLNEVIKKIAEIVPEAVSEWGAYGEVIGFNIDKVNDFITAQKTLIEIRRQERREALQKEAADIQREAQRIAYDKNIGKRFQMIGTSMVEMRISDAEMRALTAREKALTEKLNKIETDLAKLDGVITGNEGQGITTGGTKGGAGASGEGGGGGGREKTTSEALKQRERLNKAIEDAEFQLHMSRLDSDQREIESARKKYEELRALAKNNAEALQRINAMEVQEMAQLNKKHQDVWLKKANDDIIGVLKRMNKISKEKSDFERQQMDATLKASGNEAEVINRKYRALLEEYKQYGMDTANLYTQWAQELQAITEKNVVETAKRLNQAIKKDKKEEKEDNRDTDRMIDSRIRGYQALGDVMSSVLEISASNREENAKFEAQMAMFQMAIDSAVAISSTVALAAKSSTSAWDLIASIGTSTAVVLSGIARAKALLEEANAPSAPAFRADGGPTDLHSIYVDKTGNPEGYVNRPTLYSLGRRSYVAGEAGQEYVISNKMLQNPAVADFAAMLEALRTQRFFEHGGYTSGPPSGMSAGASQYDAAAMSLLAEQNKLLRAILEKPSGIEYNAFERYEKQLSYVRGRASA